jgi:hypothetical protein
MTKQVIFTGVLVVFGILSFIIGLKPFGLMAAWQEKAKKTETEITAEPEVKKEPEPEVKVEKEEKPKVDKSIQKSLTNKSEQILEAWAALKTVRGAVNVLQSIDAKTVFVVTNPVESLAPFDKILNNISGLFQFAYGVLIFEKTFLAISVSLIFMILIPLCVLVTISVIWKNKDKKEPYKIVIASVLISLVVLLAVPVSLKLSAIIEEKALSENVNSLISSMNENKENAVKFESELRGLRRVATTIMNNVSNAKVICDTAIKDMIHYLIFFMIIYILIPLLAVFGLYKITRFSVKMIMTR